MHTSTKDRSAPHDEQGPDATFKQDVAGEGILCLAHLLQLKIIEKDPRYRPRLYTGE